jgi:hypothetical protein
MVVMVLGNAAVIVAIFFMMREIRTDLSIIHHDLCHELQEIHRIVAQHDKQKRAWHVRPSNYDDVSRNNTSDAESEMARIKALAGDKRWPPPPTI